MLITTTISIHILNDFSPYTIEIFIGSVRKISSEKSCHHSFIRRPSVSIYIKIHFISYLIPRHLFLFHMSITQRLTSSNISIPLAIFNFCPFNPACFVPFPTLPLEIIECQIFHKLSFNSSAFHKSQIISVNPHCFFDTSSPAFFVIGITTNIQGNITYEF